MNQLEIYDFFTCSLNVQYFSLSIYSFDYTILQINLFHLRSNDDDSDGIDDSVSNDHDSENGDFSDENIVVYNKNDDNDEDDGDDDDGDDDDNDDDYDVGNDSRPPQLFSALCS